MRLKEWFLTSLFLAMVCGCSGAVVGTNQVVNVRLTWDKSPDPSVTGYKLYWGVSTANYTNRIDVGTNIVGTVSNLIASTTYYFAATAYNAPGLESAYSNEVNYTPFNVPPTNAPTNLRVTFQMQASTHPGTNFQNLAGATITITNTVDPLVPGSKN
jgi:hypothetical protein